MNTVNPSARIVRTITQRLSLRPPQASSLAILEDVLGRTDIAKLGDTAATLAAIQAAYPQVEEFEREFPSLCFALATGVGKTRLMGAFITYCTLPARAGTSSCWRPTRPSTTSSLAISLRKIQSTCFAALPSLPRTRRLLSPSITMTPGSACAATGEGHPTCSRQIQMCMSTSSISTGSTRRKVRATGRR